MLNDESANLLSMGAIDFGIIVDATVIMVENIFRHLAEASHRGSPFDKNRTILRASTEVTKAIFFSATIIIAGFLPLFTLSGVEGHIFGPMARTYAYALAGGLLATFTVTPALSALILPDTVGHAETRVVRALSRFYGHVRDVVLARRRTTLAVGVAAGLVATLAGSSIGLEFLPKLEEGNMWIRAVMPASISLEAGNDYANRMRRLIKGFPEAETVISQHGRPDDGTDSAGFFNAEFFVPLKPFDRWRKGVDKEALIAEINEALEKAFPGVEFTFSQYIQDNVQEAASGVKGENSVKVFGSDLETLAKVADDIKSAIATVPGVTDLAVSASLGQPTIRIDIDRAKAARYGLAPGDINATVQAAIGGQAAGDVYENGSDRHFPMVVRLAPRYRENLEAIKRIPIGTQTDKGVTQVPLSEVADVALVSGAFYIYREQQTRYVPVKFSVRGRDLGSAVLEAQLRVAEKVKIPGGYRVEWVGEFGNLKSALQRLAIAVPIAIALILLLLYVSFGSLRDTLLAGSAIPMALTGGVLALFMAGMPFSISAAIGFVALFGIAAMNGIMVLSCYNRLIEIGRRARGGPSLDLRAADAAGADDLRRSLRRPPACRLLDRDRQPGATAAGDRRGRRHAGRAAVVPHRAAGRDRPVLAPAASGSARTGRRPGAVVMRRLVELVNRRERGSPEPLMGCDKPKEERLWRAALPAGMPGYSPVHPLFTTSSVRSSAPWHWPAARSGPTSSTPMRPRPKPTCPTPRPTSSQAASMAARRSASCRASISPANGGACSSRPNSTG